MSAELSVHKTEAAVAHDMYKSRLVDVRPNYLMLCHAYVELAMAGNAEAEGLLNQLLDLAAGFHFVIESDYQQDKHVPFWGKSPQPGPTYFMSKETNYVHIMLLDATT